MSGAESLRDQAARLIQEALDAREVTRAELAHRLGVSSPHVTQTLRGDRNVTVGTLDRMLAALGYHAELSLKEPTHHQRADGAWMMSIPEGRSMENREGREQTPAALEMISRARNLHEQVGELEVEGDAVVSWDNDGAYVQAWVFIPYDPGEGPFQDELRADREDLASLVHRDPHTDPGES